MSSQESKHRRVYVRFGPLLAIVALILISGASALLPSDTRASHPGGTYHKTLLPARWWLTAADYGYDYYSWMTYGINVSYEYPCSSSSPCMNEWSNIGFVGKIVLECDANNDLL